MPRAVSMRTGKPFLTKSKAHAHDIMLELKEVNRGYVLQGAGTVLKYRVVKVKGGYGIYYKKTGKWRGDKGVRLGVPRMPKTLRRRRK